MIYRHMFSHGACISSRFVGAMTHCMPQRMTQSMSHMSTVATRHGQMSMTLQSNDIQTVTVSTKLRSNNNARNISPLQSRGLKTAVTTSNLGIRKKSSNAALWTALRNTHTIGHLEPPGGAKKNQPLDASEAPWPAGITSFMRLPLQRSAEGLDACVVGIPFDGGVSNRNGTRLGPRQIRNESIGLRPHNPANGTSPFLSMNVADIGDMGFTMYNMQEGLKQIQDQYASILDADCVPLAMGGDHTLSLPVLRALAKKHGPVACIQLDAHDDVSDTWWGCKEMHATPFRRAIEEGLIRPQNFYQIGLRGSSYWPGEYEWSKEQGITVIPCHDLWHKSAAPLMDRIRAEIGEDCPVYLTFDIDVIDPSLCPGTGTREVAGMTTIQSIEVVRGCKGLNIVGADVVEVSPAYDQGGGTAHMAAYLLFEMLCVLPKAAKKTS